MTDDEKIVEDDGKCQRTIEEDRRWKKVIEDDRREKIEDDSRWLNAI